MPTTTQRPAVSIRQRPSWECPDAPLHLCVVVPRHPHTMWGWTTGPLLTTSDQAGSHREGPSPGAVNAHRPVDEGSKAAAHWPTGSRSRGQRERGGHADG